MEEKKKKGHGCLIALIVFVVVIALGIGGCYLAYRSVKKTITQKVEDVKESTSILNEWSDAINQVSGLVNGLNSIQGGLDGNENETTVELKEDSYDKILKDFNSGAISADECVKQILYANYNDEKLSESYKVDGACDNYIDVDSLFEEYHDKLSDETKIYYYEKLLMTNVSVAYDNPKTASDDVARFKSPFCLEAKAYSMVYSLDYVYTSSNGRFRIWYTTTGDNAITHDQATSIGESLETASSNYDSLFNTQYRYDGYKLGNEQIGYVNDIMNVYIIDTGETSYAHYRFCFDDDCVRNDLVELLGVITGNSPLGISFLPYIIIRPDVVNDMQNGGLVINHELIHHYQSQVLPYTYNNGVAIDKDNSYLTEGLADWGSAMVSPSAKLPNYLSGHASMYRNQSHAFTTDYEDIIKSKGYDNFELWAGYLHFPVLDAYNNSVANGVEKMANAYFARTNGKTEYKYLEDHMTLSEARDFTQYLSYKTLSQDYNNSNFMADTSEGTLNINEVKLNDRIDAEE